MDAETTSVRILSTASRVLLVFITYALLLAATSGLVSTAGLVATPAAPQAGPEPLRGLPVVALASAGLVSWFVLRSRWIGSKLALGIALTLFGVHTVLPELEALAEAGSFSRAANDAAGSWFGGAVFAATFAVAAVVILGRTGRAERRQGRHLRSASSILADSVKVAAAAGSQIVVHAALGCRWGWYPAPDGLRLRGPLSLFCPDMSNLAGASAIGLELVRSSIWALLGLGLVRLLRREAVETSLTVGLFFALAAPAAQLLPNPLMPGDWASGQRWALAASQLVCGAALALWLSWEGPSFLPRPHAPTRKDSNDQDGRPEGAL